MRASYLTSSILALFILACCCSSYAQNSAYTVFNVQITDNPVKLTNDGRIIY